MSRSTPSILMLMLLAGCSGSGNEQGSAYDDAAAGREADRALLAAGTAQPVAQAVLSGSHGNAARIGAAGMSAQLLSCRRPWARAFVPVYR